MVNTKDIRRVYMCRVTGKLCGLLKGDAP